MRPLCRKACGISTTASTTVWFSAFASDGKLEFWLVVDSLFIGMAPLFEILTSARSPYLSPEATTPCANVGRINHEALAEFAFDRKPFRCHRIEIEYNRRTRADLTSGIEDPGFSDSINPRAIRVKRRVVNVSREHEVRSKAPKPLHEIFVSREFPRRNSAHRSKERPKPRSCLRACDLVLSAENASVPRTHETLDINLAFIDAGRLRDA
jgi:hypothetical protein